mgnify:CR=1 FL=1
MPDFHDNKAWNSRHDDLSKYLGTKNICTTMYGDEHSRKWTFSSAFQVHIVRAVEWECGLNPGFATHSAFVYFFMHEN